MLRFWCHIELSASPDSMSSRGVWRAVAEIDASLPQSCMEVTLNNNKVPPRHWSWHAGQSGTENGASSNL